MDQYLAITNTYVRGCTREDVKKLWGKCFSLKENDGLTREKMKELITRYTFDEQEFDLFPHCTKM